jgi:hypothetical protein
LGALEDKGSPQVRLLAERLDNEIANRKDADNDLRAETTKIDTTVTWMIRGGVLAATSGIASVAVYLLTSGRP